MSGAAHTQTPWGLGIPYRDSTTGVWNCLITKNGVAFITVCGPTKEECEANARLVAAAPDLQEALKKVRKLNPSFGSEEWDAADAAIARAGAA